MIVLILTKLLSQLIGFLISLVYWIADHFPPFFVYLNCYLCELGVVVGFFSADQEYAQPLKGLVLIPLRVCYTLTFLNESFASILSE